MSESKLIFAWEDQGVAGLKYFKCDACGYVEHSNAKTVRADSGFKCPECGQEFKLTWVGMQWEEKDE